MQSLPKEIQAVPVQKDEVVINEWLTDAERSALADFESHFQSEPSYCPLGPELCLKLFTLFISGQSIKEIKDLNPSYTLGQIVYAAVEGKWDVKRQEYLEDLYRRAREGLAQTVAESAQFMSTALRVAHKKIGDKFNKYLQTGDEAWLKDLDFDLSTIRKYREGVEILMKVTGQDRIKNVHVEGNVEHTEAPALPEPVQVATSIAELAAKKRLGAASAG